MDLKSTIELAWENRELLQEASTQEAIRSIIADLDTGKLRVATPTEAENGSSMIGLKRQ